MLDSGFLVNYIVALLIGLIFFLFFLYVSLTVGKYRWISVFTRTKFGYFAVYFVLGLVVGLVNLFMNLVDISLNSNYPVVADISLIVICGFCATPYLFAGASVSYLTSSILFAYGDPANLAMSVYLFIFYCALVAIVTMLHALGQKKFAYFVAISVPATFVLLVLAVAFVPRASLDVALLIPWIALAYCLIYYLFSVPLINYVGKTRRLYQAIGFNKNQMALAAYANDFLHEKAIGGDTQYGMLVLFKVETQDDRDGKISDLIVAMIRSKIDLLFERTKDNWFVSPRNYCGVFIPLPRDRQKNLSLKRIYQGNNLPKRREDDLFYGCELVCDSLPKKIRTERTAHEISVKVAGALYGVHSSDFGKIISLAEVLVRQYDFLKKTNVVQVFDPNEFRLFETDSNVYKKLSETIPLADLSVYLDEYATLRGTGERLFFANCSRLSKFQLNKDEVLAHAGGPETADGLVRFLGMRAIGEFQKQGYDQQPGAALIVDYPASTLNGNEFNSRNFLFKLHQRRFSPERLIINLVETSGQRRVELNGVALQNINYLRSRGVRFAISSKVRNAPAALKKVSCSHFLVSKRIANPDALVQFLAKALDGDVAIAYPK